MEPEPPGAAFFWPGAGADPFWSEPEPESAPGPRTSGAAKKKWRLGNTGCNSLKYSQIQFFVNPPNSRSKIPVYREFDLNLCRCYKQMIYFNFEVPVFKLTEDPSLFFFISQTYMV